MDKKYIKIIILIMIILVSGIGIFILKISQTHSGLGYSYMSCYDGNAAGFIRTGVLNFLQESECYDLSDLYDSEGKKLVFKQNDQDSVKKLIISLQDIIFYKSKPYGPYFAKNNSNEATYDHMVPPIKDFQGYKIEIFKSKEDVQCFSVRDKAEAVIVIH